MVRLVYLFTQFLCTVLRLVQPSLLAPPEYVCSTSFSLEITAQRSTSVTRMHATLATSAGCPVAWGELKATSRILLSLMGELLLEARLQVQCRQYASSMHILPLPGGENISAWETGSDAGHFTICDSRCDWTSLQYQGCALEIAVLTIALQQRGFRGIGIA